MKPMMEGQNDPVISLPPTPAEKSLRRRRSEPLTRPEREILLGLERAIRLHGSPSLKEIASLAGPTYWASTAHKYLKQLEIKGYVQMMPGRQRGARLLHKAPPVEKKAGSNNKKRQVRR